jgi:hypothetical protein
VLLGGGRDNTFRGNLFIDQPIGIHVDARGPHGIIFDRPDSWNLLAKCEELGYQSPLWKERYPRLAKTMEESPLQPMGNSMHANILIGCKKPFDLRKEVDPQWLDRANNAEWQLAEFPELSEDGPPARLGSASVQTVRCQLHVEDRHEAVTVSTGPLRSVVSRMVVQRRFLRGD